MHKLNQIGIVMNTDKMFIGKKRLVRTYSAGVWFGEIIKKKGNEVILKDARRLWHWKAAKSISLSGVALYGIVDKVSRIAPPVNSVWLEAIELIECSDLAVNSIAEAAHAISS